MLLTCALPADVVAFKGLSKQDPAIFTDFGDLCTLRANFTYGSEKELDRLGSSRKVNAHLTTVLERLQIKDHFTSSKFPQGLDTRLQRNRLTGGEKRSVANTRAMIGTPPILLLDEPTAGLDAWKEDVVRVEMVDRRPAGQTVVCIAHALSTIRSADFILFLGEDGTIKEQGTWAELVQLDGGFASFVAIQSLDGKPKAKSSGGGGGGGGGGVGGGDRDTKILN